jgi:hypothetical protein
MTAIAVVGSSGDDSLGTASTVNGNTIAYAILQSGLEIFSRDTTHESCADAI